MILQKKEFVTIKNKPVLYNKTYNFLIADTRRWFCSDTEFNYELFRKENKPIGRPMLEAEAYDLFLLKETIRLYFITVAVILILTAAIPIIGIG